MVTKFENKVYELCKKVPKGKITSYKEIGDKIGIKGYRAVGMALNKNPFAPIVPCHRVCGSDGNLVGFASGLKKKAELLRKEGIKIKNNKIENFNSVLYKF
ncbi:MAG: MGMT family protein [Nanoarchaeota archaeon]|nr:MGMT family protein [Nanoarchaeota archaeon]